MGRHAVLHISGFQDIGQGDQARLAPTASRAGEDRLKVHAFRSQAQAWQLLLHFSLLPLLNSLASPRAPTLSSFPFPRVEHQLALDLALPTSCSSCADLSWGSAVRVWVQGPETWLRGPGRLHAGVTRVGTGAVPQASGYGSACPPFPPALSQLQQGAGGGRKRKDKLNWVHLVSRSNLKGGGGRGQAKRAWLSQGRVGWPSRFPGHSHRAVSPGKGGAGQCLPRL